MQQAHGPHNEGNSQLSIFKDGKPKEENMENGTPSLEMFVSDSVKEMVRRFREALEWAEKQPLDEKEKIDYKNIKCEDDEVE